MIEETGTFPAADGLTIFERSWRHDTIEPVATVAILHGGAEHSGRYAHVARRITAAGYTIIAFDRRSHGRSERVRGVPLQVDDFATVFDDTAHWLLGKLDEDPDQPLFVLAHAMGALIVVGLAIQGRLPVTGLITLGAALRVLAADGFAAAERAASSDPDTAVVPLGRHGFDASTRDPEMLAAVAADPTHQDVPGVPARFLHQVALVTAEVQSQFEAVDLPVLVLHGTADVMADPATSVDLYERASSTDKSLHLVDGGYHALLRDFDREATLSLIIDWMNQRLLRG